MSLELNTDDTILLRFFKETLKRISNYGHICFNSPFVTYDPAVEALNLLLQKEYYRTWYPNWQLNGNNSLKQELGDSFQWKKIVMNYYVTQSPCVYTYGLNREMIYLEK